jgi:hypothetical protein
VWLKNDKSYNENLVYSLILSLAKRKQPSLSSISLLQLNKKFYIASVRKANVISLYMPLEEQILLLYKAKHH